MVRGEQSEKNVPEATATPGAATLKRKPGETDKQFDKRLKQAEEAARAAYEEEDDLSPGECGVVASVLGLLGFTRARSSRKA